MAAAPPGPKSRFLGQKPAFGMTARGVGARYEERLLHREQKCQMGFAADVGSDGARGVCGEHARASPGGKQREQAPALYTEVSVSSYTHSNRARTRGNAREKCDSIRA